MNICVNIQNLTKVFHNKKMINAETKQNSCFCVFHHMPFARGKEGDDDGGHILEKLIYKYPETISDRAMENFLSVIISFYTFTTLSLNNKQIDFLSWSNSKVAIRIFETLDKTLIFFVLRVSSTYSDHAISREIDFIKRGIFFALGPEQISNIDVLKEYFRTKGPNLSFTKFISNSSHPKLLADPISFSFSNLPHLKWNRASVATVLIEVTIMQTYSTIWGIVSLYENKLLASHMPIDMINYSEYLPPSHESNSEFFKQGKVYITKEDRMNLLAYPGSIAQIPDEEIIECFLFKYQYESIVFYLLADPKITQEESEKIPEILTHEMAEIVSTASSPPSLSEPPSSGMSVSDSYSALNLIDDVSLFNYELETNSDFPPNSIVYNSVLHVLQAGQPTEEFQQRATYVHDLFATNDSLRDIILHNAKEFVVCMNIFDVEFYSSVSEHSKMGLKYLYDKCLQTMPGLKQYIENLHFSKEE